MRKVALPVDKRAWRPSLLPGPLFLISTYGTGREPNVAPKSWVQMVAFQPPTLMFSGTRGNTTERNLESTGCFALNLVDASLAPRVYGCLRWFGRERIERLGLTLDPATRIDAPLVRECRAHLECRLVRTTDVGSGHVVFGEIVAGAIWEEIALRADRRYELLDQALFLEDGLFARVNAASPAEAGGPDGAGR